MIIGLGFHARRIYYPILENKNKNILIVDTKDQQKLIEEFLRDRKVQPLDKLFIDKFSEKFDKVPMKIKKLLSNYVKKWGIKGVIISTDPLYHHQYAQWALDNNLSILMDKPITAVKNASTLPKNSDVLIQHYNRLEKKYKKVNKINRKILFSIVSQRRFHKGFQKVRELLKEVYDSTNCPVTSIQVSHSDGQWRLPSEIIDIDYHSYNQGFGKCSHSGYHFMDMVNYFTNFNTESKKIGKVSINSKFLRPLDFLGQINLKDYEKIFGKKFKKYNKYSMKEMEKIMKNYGEIDAFINLSLKNKDKIICLASINLIHNSFSQRGNLLPNKNLYKGNGRVRHETYTIQQGPFQCIQIISLQSKEVKKNQKENFEIGGEHNFQIYVFRNNVLYKKWKNLEKFSLNDLQKSKMEGSSRGHQEDARLCATEEFLLFLEGKKKKDFISDFLTHKNNVKLMAGIYKSAALDFNNKDPEVLIKYERNI